MVGTENRADGNDTIVLSDAAKSAPLEQKIQQTSARPYARVAELEKLALDIYSNNGQGITTADVQRHFGISKPQAARKIKHAIRANILYTRGRSKPQQYFPTCKRADIEYERQKNVRNRVSLGTYPDRELAGLFMQRSAVDYLQLLKSTFANAALSLHKLQLQFRLQRDAYDELDLSVEPSNMEKKCEYRFGRAVVSYHVNRTGVVVIHVACSREPFKLASGEDVLELYGFLGQVRDRFVCLLHNSSESMVPCLLDWAVRRCDVNKDVPLEPLELQCPSLNFQIRHLSNVFRAYIKPMRANTMLRVEQELTLSKPMHELLRDILIHEPQTPLPSPAQPETGSTISQAAGADKPRIPTLVEKARHDLVLPYLQHYSPRYTIDN